jgi:uncharacterized protein (DUF111 family)
VKVSAGRAKPEFDDAVAAATALGRPVRDVLAAAEARYAAERSGREDKARHSDE